VCPAPVKQCEMDAMKGREAAIEGFGWGALAGIVLVALMYGAGSLLGLKPLTQALNEPLLAVMPGFIFGFLIDTLQHAGKVVEAGSRKAVLSAPRHPYTRALLDALPHPEGLQDKPLVAIAGAPPSPGAIPSGCSFHPRCSYAQESCVHDVPPLLARGDRLLACPIDPLVER